MALKYNKKSFENAQENEAGEQNILNGSVSHFSAVQDRIPEKAYNPAPVFSIDTAIFCSLWNDANGEDTEWVLESYPIMPDGTVAVIYSAEKEDGSADYFIVHIGPDGSDFSVIGTYSLTLDCFRLGSAFVVGDELWGVLADMSGLYMAQKIIPWDENTRYSVGHEIHSMVVRSDGTPAVAYHSVLRGPDNSLLALFDKKGNADVYRDRFLLECRDVNLDSAENVWAYMFPSDSLIRFSEEGGHVRIPVSLQGFSAFAMSSDRQKLVTFFNRYEDECCIYVQHLTPGGYSEPVPFIFDPADGFGDRIRMDTCRFYGQVSAMKDRFILRADDCLFYYSADTLQETNI